MLVWLCRSYVRAKLTPSQEWLPSRASNDISFLQVQHAVVILQYLHSQSYFKCQGQFNGALSKYGVADKWTVFRLAAHFRETGSVCVWSTDSWSSYSFNPLKPNGH